MLEAATGGQQVLRRRPGGSGPGQPGCASCGCGAFHGQSGRKGCSEMGCNAVAAGNLLWGCGLCPGCVRAPARENRPATEYVEGFRCRVECWNTHSVPFPGFSTENRRAGCVRSGCQGTDPGDSFVLVQDLSTLGLWWPSQPWEVLLPLLINAFCVVSEISLHLLPQFPEGYSRARITPSQ